MSGFRPSGTARNRLKKTLSALFRVHAGMACNAMYAVYRGAGSTTGKPSVLKESEVLRQGLYAHGAAGKLFLTPKTNTANIVGRVERAKFNSEHSDDFSDALHSSAIPFRSIRYLRFINNRFLPRRPQYKTLKFQLLTPGHLLTTTYICYNYGLTAGGSPVR